MKGGRKMTLCRTWPRKNKQIYCADITITQPWKQDFDSMTHRHVFSEEKYLVCLQYTLTVHCDAANFFITPSRCKRTQYHTHSYMHVRTHTQTLYVS